VHPVTTRILQLREDPGPRAALRRGGSPSTDHYAYPYLALWWSNKEYLRAPILALGALAASYPKMGHDPANRLGALARSLTTGGTKSDQEKATARTGTLLVAAQSADLAGLTPILRRILSQGQAKALGVNWDDLYWLLTGWEHPDEDKRRATRRRLLEQYYHASPAAAAAGTADNPDPTEEQS